MKISSIYRSICGEGYFAGKTAVFVRFFGCNLSCSWCDESHRGYKSYSENEVIGCIRRIRRNGDIICLTGGEPLLQVSFYFLTALKKIGFVTVETNGTCDLLADVWNTVSPKQPIEKSFVNANEIKIVMTNVWDEDALKKVERLHHYCYLYLQPLWDNTVSLQRSIDFVLDHPFWRLSLQTHKYISLL